MALVGLQTRGQTSAVGYPTATPQLRGVHKRGVRRHSVPPGAQAAGGFVPTAGSQTPEERMACFWVPRCLRRYGRALTRRAQQPRSTWAHGCRPGLMLRSTQGRRRGVTSVVRLSGSWR
eukprot:1533321-Pyramimonas_sp.AAC.1